MEGGRAIDGLTDGAFAIPRTPGGFDPTARAATACPRESGLRIRIHQSSRCRRRATRRSLVAAAASVRRSSSRSAVAPDGRCILLGRSRFHTDQTRGNGVACGCRDLERVPRVSSPRWRSSAARALDCLDTRRTLCKTKRDAPRLGCRRLGARSLLDRNGSATGIAPSQDRHDIDTESTVATPLGHTDRRYSSTRVYPHEVLRPFNTKIGWCRPPA